MTAPTQAAPLSAAAVFSPIAAELAEAERQIQAVADVGNPLLRQTLRLILSSGGKRLRPALVLLASGLHPTTLQRRIDLAMAAELLHTATLVHDDVIDVSDSRRGNVTVNAAYGNTLAVLTGDYLFGKSGELVSGLGSPEIMAVFSWAVMELVQGEMMRPTLDTELDTTESQYLAKIRGKTASLLAMCSQTGAMLDASDPRRVCRLRDYGMSLGMAFQIVDDVLDYVGTEAQLGKPVGSDLRQGTITLPAIVYLRRHPHDAVVRGLLAQDEQYLDRVDWAVGAVRASGAVEEALARAREFAGTAEAQLDGLPEGPMVDAMRALARYVVERRE